MDVVVDGMRGRTVWKSVRYAGEHVVSETLVAVVDICHYKAASGYSERRN